MALLPCNHAGYVFVFALDIAYGVFLVVAREEEPEYNGPNYEGLWVATGAFLAIKSGIMMTLSVRIEVVQPAWDPNVTPATERSWLRGQPTTLQNTITQFRFFKMALALAHTIVI